MAIEAWETYLSVFRHPAAMEEPPRDYSFRHDLSEEEFLHCNSVKFMSFLSTTAGFLQPSALNLSLFVRSSFLSINCGTKVTCDSSGLAGPALETGGTLPTTVSKFPKNGRGPKGRTLPIPPKAGHIELPVDSVPEYGSAGVRRSIGCSEDDEPAFHRGEPPNLKELLACVRLQVPWCGYH